MKKVHFTLQGKGGVGKSFVSSLIAQYHVAHSIPVVCIDTDPVNATLVGYKSLNAQRVELMDGSTLNERNFDEMMEQILELDTDFVIDNGAASFIPLSNYLLENDAIRMIGESGKEVVVHTVITGGQAALDTLRGFQSLATQLPPGTPLIVWLNEYFGAIELDGKGFEEMKVYRENKDKVSGMITIPRQTSSTFGKDVEAMLDRRLTFSDVAASDFGLMAKQRLATVQRALFTQLAGIM
jgi:hypothetical protein